MISLAPAHADNCTACGHSAEHRILHRHLDGGNGAVCAAIVSRPDPDSIGSLCGCVSCPVEPPAALGARPSTTPSSESEH